MNDCKNKYCGGGLRLCCLECKTIDICPAPCPGDYTCKWAELTPSERYRAWYNTRMAIIAILLTVWVIGSLSVIMWMVNQLNDKVETIQIIKQTVDPVPDTTEANQGLTQEEFDLICKVVAAESRGEPYETMRYVASTIYNRSKEWGMTPTEIVTARGQYADPFSGHISEEVKWAVTDVFNGNPIPGVTHFHDTSVLPYWADDYTLKASRGTMRFYGGDKE